MYTTPRGTRAGRRGDLPNVIPKVSRAVTCYLELIVEKTKHEDESMETFKTPKGKI